MRADGRPQRLYLAMDHLLLLLLLTSGLQAEGKLNSPESFRLVGGDSRCAGTLELKHEGEWRPVNRYYTTLKTAAAVCRVLNCGSAVSVEQKSSSRRFVWSIRSGCFLSRSALECAASSGYTPYILDLTCSDSVRLVNGTSLCSGRLELKSDQSNQSWSSVCEADFDQECATSASSSSSIVNLTCSGKPISDIIYDTQTPARMAVNCLLQP
ncbi:scavenger receptor cysteine-rich type 1 protein M130-like [Centropristis striata]|uniref:scavenger receptor cysteine-rich type 1 protein M130-like n=1 Tax=Centropristis striata TaxID=184440 RepID=UPI0027E0B98E|nr:scavenger receptor cysteine-rich type 1 protein M130-like [Centropristis striata]